MACELDIVRTKLCWRTSPYVTGLHLCTWRSKVRTPMFVLVQAAQAANRTINAYLCYIVYTWGHVQSFFCNINKAGESREGLLVPCAFSFLLVEWNITLYF